MSDTLFDSSFSPPVGTALTPQALCPGDLPLVLLPVRLETRFFTTQDNVTELRIRIYPDKIHVDTHQPELTTDERTWGTQYWQQDWAAGSDNAARADAWRTLAGRFGAPRAAWIARVLQPTNLAQRPGTPPIFPTLPPVGVGGESAWRYPPRARLLPDRWVAIVHSNGKAMYTATSKDVKQPLAVGPDPQAPKPDDATEAAILAGEQLAMDPGMLWMVDFDEAENVGMGIRLRIPPSLSTANTRLESLLVFGVASSLDVATSAAQLADLLDAHHYTDGLEFLRFGTPTNNTDDRRAGYASEDPGHARSFNNEVLSRPDGAPNAIRVGTALGLSFPRISPTLGRLGQASQDHDLDLRSMNTALWPVGWGYFLSNMMGAESGITPGAIDWVRGHFLDHVRWAGPLPAMRFGSQPYGILPVTSLDLWAAEPNDADAARRSWLRSLLLNMRENVWRPVLNRVARIGLRQNPPDPDADLADVMRTDGVANGYLARNVLGRHYLEHLYVLDARDFSAIAQAQGVVASKMLKLLNLPNMPRLAKGFMSPSTWRIVAPLVQAGEVSPWQMLQPDYIGALLSMKTIDAIVAARPNPEAKNDATSLLQVLLRHAMLREIAQAAARILAPLPGNDLAALLRDAELNDLVDAPVQNHTLQAPATTFHWKRQLAQPMPGPNSSLTIRQYLESLTDFSALEVASLGQFRTSLAHLQTLDSESLQLLMEGTLDLSSHRLDAWITSFANQRLASMTKDGPKGQIVGAYGWVENLRPAQGVVQVPDAAVPVGEKGPMIEPAKDSGFIHAPSMTHASAAALLRNAHLGPSGDPDPDGAFAIDLSSSRVREASRLLDGIRQGQPLGALLGYRIERRLHELKLDASIAPLRALAPLAVRAREPNALPTEAIAANNVVDGLVLLRRWQDPSDTAVSNLLASLPADAKQKITLELQALHDAVDGLSDSLLSEAAYQMARGNPSRMANTLAAIAHGDAMPPELEVAQMPRSGTPLTHRLMVLLSGGPQTAPGWASVGNSVLANNNRMLNAWVSRLLCDARKVRCTVERLDDTTGTVAETQHFPLSEVVLTQLDFLSGLEAGGDGSPSLSLVEQWVLYQAQRRSGGFGAQSNLRLQHARPTDLAAGESTLFDALEQGRAIRRLLEKARGARPDDLAPPGGTTAAAVDLVDLEARVVRGENSLSSFHNQLTSRVADGAAIDAETLRTNLLALFPFGLGPAVPCVAVGDTPEIRAALIRQAKALLKVSGPRVEKIAALRALPVASDPRARCDQLLERGRNAFGPAFVMLPSITVDAAGAAELKQALAASTAQQGGDPLAVHGWFTRSARVREPASQLAACMRNAEVLATGDRLSLAVAQLPFDSSERWVGLPPLPDTEIAPGKLSMVVQSSLALDPTLPLCGLFVDEWTEVVPSKRETTAITFQFDPPNSFAPQNVLVAVPPVPGQAWTTETLRRVLMETLDLAKLRAVEPSLLGAAAQYLPALYIPFNSADGAGAPVTGTPSIAADAAVSTDFKSLTA